MRRTETRRMTDRSQSDRICRKWELIRRLDEKRAQVHAGVIDTWKRFRARTEAQQNEIAQVLAIALHQLAECDRMEQTLKQ